MLAVIWLVATFLSQSLGLDLFASKSEA